MGKGKKMPRQKNSKSNNLIAIASIVTAITALLKVIFDFIIQFLSLGQ